MKKHLQKLKKKLSFSSSSPSAKSIPEAPRTKSSVVPIEVAEQEEVAVVGDVGDDTFKNKSPMTRHLQKLKKKFSFNRTSSPKSVMMTLKEEPAEVVIVGAGIVGLVLALALHKHLGIKPELYEQAQAFHDDVGAG